MTTFINQLTNRLTNQRDALKAAFHVGEGRVDEELRAAVLSHWHSPLPARSNGKKLPAFAVDGSSRRADLVNGSTLFVAQALLIGEGLNEPLADIEILPGTVRASTLDRFADLMRQSLEIGLARSAAERIPPGSLIYLDGAIYGTLSQLYAFKEEQGIADKPQYDGVLLRDYHALFETCRQQGIQLISIAKTNRQALFSRVIQLQLGRPSSEVQEISDSAIIDELTERKSGFSTPLLLGTHSFSSGWESPSSRSRYEQLKREPAIVSFFVRLDDLDDALRIDVPANCVGRADRIGDVDYELLPPETVLPVVDLLQSDYGGMQVYNALAYVSDVEVRLTKQKMHDIYLPMIADALGEEIRVDRSQRRFVE